MDKQRIVGTAKEATGAVKEKIGRLVGSRHIEMKGKAEKVEGKVRIAVGRVKDAARAVAGKK